MPVLTLMPLVVIPMPRGVATFVTLVGLVPRVPQHVSLQIHTLVAAVSANGTVERFGARVDPLVAPQIGQVPAGVATGGAGVGFLACVHSEVAFEVVQM